jgi:hypothetical protein
MNPKTVVFLVRSGAADRIRTYDRLVNSQPLYRAEPRRHTIACMYQLEGFTKKYLRLAIQVKKDYAICRTLRLAKFANPL